MHSTSMSEGEDDNVEKTRVFVSELHPHDVLLGRGTGPSMNEGNVKFREIVEGLKASYVSTPSRKAKKKIVRKAVNDIKAKNGRFLTKLRKAEIRMLGMKSKAVYEIVADSVAIEKTKQAIRYVHYKKDPGFVKKPSPDPSNGKDDGSSTTDGCSGNISSHYDDSAALNSDLNVKIHVPTPPSRPVAQLKSDKDYLSSSVSQTHQEDPQPQGQLFPTPLSTTLDGLLFNHRLNTMLSAPNQLGLAQMLPQTRQQVSIDTIQPIASSLERINPPSIFRSMNSTPAGLLPFMPGNSIATSVSQGGVNANALPATNNNFQHHEQNTTIRDGQLLALLQADDERRRLIESYISSLPPM